jgi:hypothetical protein
MVEHSNKGEKMKSVVLFLFISAILLVGFVSCGGMQKAPLQEQKLEIILTLCILVLSILVAILGEREIRRAFVVPNLRTKMRVAQEECLAITELLQGYFENSTPTRDEITAFFENPRQTILQKVAEIHALLESETSE